MSRSTSRSRAWLAVAVAATGVAVGVAGTAVAATNDTAAKRTAAARTAAAKHSTAAARAAARRAAAARRTAANAATADHGPGETLLTGADLAKATAAAKAAVPGATIVRVESDSDGAAYEAHVTKADGSTVTVKLDSSFNVTSTEDGMGAGPGGTHP